MSKRKFQNSSFCWEETVQDNRFYFSLNNGAIPTENEAYFAFIILYRDVLFDDDSDVDVNCTYDESHNRMVVVVTQKGTTLMPRALMRTKDHMPMPSFPMKLQTVKA